MDSTRAIIIKTETSGEADILVTAYTKLFGKEMFVARGGRKMAAKLRSDLQPYTLVDLSFVRGKNNFLLTGAKTLEWYIGPHASLHDFCAAALIGEIVNIVIVQPERDERLFVHLLSSFRALTDADPERNTWVILQRFFWELLALQGVFLLSDACRRCGTAFIYGAWRVASGELVCGNCAKGEGIAFDQEDLYALGQLIKSSLGKDIPEHVSSHLNAVLEAILMQENAYGAPNAQAFTWFLERVI